MRNHLGRSVRALALALAAGGGALLALHGCARVDERPNIVLVSVDTLRRDALAAFAPRAAPPLPVLDALARRSVRFDRAFSAAAWTLPSHASLLTGTYPHRHGAIHRRATVSPRVPSLPAILAARGYQTVAFTDGGFLDASYGFGRGFERYDDHLSRGVAPLSGLPRDGRPSPDGSSDLFARAMAFLHRRSDARPLFLFVHSYAVHDYYKDHAATAAQAERNLACLTGRADCSDDEWQQLGIDYRSELRRLDGAMGALLATVDSRLRSRPTWIVLLSDHGEGLDPASGPPHHGGALDPRVLEVPLLVVAPGLRPRRIHMPVSLVDVAPTLVAAAGAGGADFDGRSLLRVMRGGAGGWLAEVALDHRTLEAEEHYYWWREGRRFEERDIHPRALAVAVVRNGWWYEKSSAGERSGPLRPAPYASPPLLALRAAAQPWLQTRAAATPTRAASVELERTLASLGYGGGTGAP